MATRTWLTDAAALRDDRRDADDGVARRRLGQLLVRPPDPVRERPAPQRDDELVRREPGLEGPLEEAVERHDPLASAGAQDHRVVQGQAERRQVAGRIGMGDRPADRAAVADLHVADVGDGLDRDLQRGRVEDLGIGRQRADLVAAVGLRPDAPELVEAADVDERVGARQPQLHAAAAGSGRRPSPWRPPPAFAIAAGHRRRTTPGDSRTLPGSCLASLRAIDGSPHGLGRVRHVQVADPERTQARR